jgi:hypothetical protein
VESDSATAGTADFKLSAGRCGISVSVRPAIQKLQSDGDEEAHDD